MPPVLNVTDVALPHLHLYKQYDILRHLGTGEFVLVLDTPANQVHAKTGYHLYRFTRCDNTGQPLSDRVSYLEQHEMERAVYTLYSYPTAAT